jgi:hypothetical protein
VVFVFAFAVAPGRIDGDHDFIWVREKILEDVFAKENIAERKNDAALERVGREVQ